MPAGSGHGVSEGCLAALHRFPQAESSKNASVLARECSLLTLLVYDGARRSRISPSARFDRRANPGDTGSAQTRDFLKKIE